MAMAVETIFLNSSKTSRPQTVSRLTMHCAKIRSESKITRTSAKVCLLRALNRKKIRAPSLFRVSNCGVPKHANRFETLSPIKSNISSNEASGLYSGLEPIKVAMRAPFCSTVSYVYRNFGYVESIFICLSLFAESISGRSTRLFLARNLFLVLLERAIQ
jgi:hypothetical protein